MAKLAHNQPVAHMIEYYTARLTYELNRNGQTDYAEDLAARVGYYAHASTHMEIICDVRGNLKGHSGDVWALISVKDHHGRIWQDRELSRIDYVDDVAFYSAIAEKMQGYKRYWIEGKK